MIHSSVLDDELQRYELLRPGGLMVPNDQRAELSMLPVVDGLQPVYNRINS